MFESTPQFPPDAGQQTYLAVQAIVAGRLYLRDKRVFQDSIHLPDSSGFRAPDFCFLITHPTKGRILFDLGIRKNGKGYPPAVDKLLGIFELECEDDVADTLKKGGIDPTTINTIIYSHLHWDHVGDPTPFTNAQMIIGADAQPLWLEAYPSNPNGRYQELPADRPITYISFDPYTSTHPIISPIGTFEKAIDLFADRTLYLVSAPGHMPGHLAALVRVAPNSFIFLAGDTCHDRQCYDPGERLISQENYMDLETARDTVTKLMRMNREMDEVIVVLAHEKERDGTMPVFPEELGTWVVNEIRKRKASRSLPTIKQ